MAIGEKKVPAVLVVIVSGRFAGVRKNGLARRF
jgi:hypothetical protein